MNSVCYNGKFYPEDEPLLTAQNRGFKYGDGVFETMKIYEGDILLQQYHIHRLLVSLKTLSIENSFDTEYISSVILDLCKKNNCDDLARVRLAVFRNKHNKAEYIMEALSLSNDVNQLNEKGFAIDLFPYVRKSADSFSNLKTANFLPYVMAGLYIKEKSLDDCIVLNTENNLCDSSKANIFLIKNAEIFTPALNQGCINGVMRRFLIEELQKLNYTVHQSKITEQDLYNADEVFLTNAIYGMRWVKAFRQKEYSLSQTYSIYKKMFSTLYI